MCVYKLKTVTGPIRKADTHIIRDITHIVHIGFREFMTNPYQASQLLVFRKGVYFVILILYIILEGIPCYFTVPQKWWIWWYPRLLGG